MSTTYNARGGESWNEVARNTTGNDLDAAKIARANPGVLTPIAAGTLLQIPGEGPSGITSATAAELEVRIDKTPVGTLDEFTFASSIDAIAQCSFTLPNEPETRALLQPLGSQEVTVDVLGQRVFTGRASSPIPQNSVDRRSLDVECYSTPGILERVSPPLSAFPLEFTNANLIAIAGDLCSYHSVVVDFQAHPGALFERVDIQPSEPVLTFLSGLASQRGPVITSDAFGRLVFWESVSPGKPVGEYEKGYAPAQNVLPQFNEEQWYSSVTGKIPAKSKRGKKGEQFTVENPYATDLVRPYTFEVRDIDPGELETAVQTAAGRMFSEVFSVDLEMSTWFDGNGQLFRPNTTIRLKSPDDYIEDFYEFLISTVSLTKSAGAELATLTLVLPGAYSGEIPEVLPWQL